MESFPRFERKNIDAKEKIRSLKKPLVQLFAELKKQITETGFDGILSDDTGARIQHLFFVRCIKN